MNEYLIIIAAFFGNSILIGYACYRAGHKSGELKGWQDGYFSHPAQLRAEKVLRDKQGRFISK
jgi:hypothetical protein